MERRASPPGKRARRPSPRERLAIDGSRHASGDDNRRRISEYWAGRLEIGVADIRIGGVTTTGQIATRAIAGSKFEMIGARGNRANSDAEDPVSVNVGGDNSEFHPRDTSGHALPCGRVARRTTGDLSRKLAKRRGNCGAEDVHSDLIQLAGRRTPQGKGDRQFARRRVHGPTDLARCVVKWFAEVVPA